MNRHTMALVPFALLPFGASTSHGAEYCTPNYTATLSAGQQWSDRYNLNVSVTGSDNWRGKMTLPSPEAMIASWNTPRASTIASRG